MKKFIPLYFAIFLFIVSAGSAFAASISLSSNFTAASLSIGASDTFTTNGYNVDIDTGGITIAATGTLNASSGVGGTTTIYDAGNWANSGAFTAGNSTVTFDGAAVQSVTRGSSAFNAVVVTNASAAGVTFADALSTATLTDITNASTLKFATSGTHTVSTTLTLTGGSGANMITLAPSVAATNWNFSPPAGTTVTGVNVSYSQSDKTITANSSNNGGNNTNWVFGGVTRYWVGAGAGNPEDWDDNANWSDASGGAGGFSYPVAGDTAVFNGAGANGNKNITLDAAVSAVAITNTGGYTGVFNLAGYNVTLSGSLQWDGGTLNASTGTPTITVGGNWDLSAGTFTAGASTVNMIGNGKTYYTSWFAPWNLTIGDGTNPASVTYSVETWVNVADNDLAVANNATLTITGGFYIYLPATGDITVNAGATLNVNNPGVLTRRINDSSLHINSTLPDPTVGTITGTGTFEYFVASGSLAAPVTARTYGTNLAVAGALNAIGVLGGGPSLNLGAKTLYLYDADTNNGDYGILDNPGNIPITAAALQVGTSNPQGKVGTLRCRGAVYTFTNVNVYSSTNPSPTIDCLFGGASSTWNISGNVTIDGVYANKGLITAGSSTWNVSGNLSNSGTVTAGSSNFNVGGNWINGASAVFTAGTGTVRFNGTGTQSITSAGDAFNNLTVTNSSNIVTFADVFTTNNFTATTASTRLNFTAGTTNAISGTLSLNGQAGGTEVRLRSTVSGTRYALNVTGGAQTVSYVNVQDSNASGNNITANNSIDNGNNDNGSGAPQWVFGNVTRYWVGTNGGAWNNNSNWASSSGGAGGADYPDSGDTAIFDGGGTNGCTLTGSVSTAVITMQAGYTGANAKLDANGSDITTTSTLTITGGELELDTNSDLTVGGTLTVNGGTLDGANGAIDANGSVTFSSGILNAPSGNFNIAGSFAHSSGTFTNSSGTVIFDTSTASTISGDTTFNNLTCTTAGKQLTFTAGTTQTVAGTLTLTGVVGNLITLRSSAPGSKWDITLSGGAQSVSLLDVRDSDANTNTATCVNCLDSGNNNANWLFDPFGIVFDSLTNNPIQGAVVSLWYDTGGGNWILARPGIEIGAADTNPQTTGAAGAYNYLTINGTFRFTITAAGYAYPSTKSSFPVGRIICPGNPACAGVSGSKGETFVVAGLAIQMDHPMDGGGSLIYLNKEANKQEASIGDIITYTLTIQNKTSSSVTNVLIEDKIPAGFKYVTDRTILDGQKTGNPDGQRPLIFTVGTLTAGQTRTLRYQLIVGSGVTFGKYENSAWARYSDSTVISNVAKEEVIIVPDPLFDLGTIIGKVFWDINGNGIQDGQEIKSSESQETAISPYDAVTSTEPGIAGVNIMTEEGTVITTDKDGKYHLAGVAPGRHILRIDENTLSDLSAVAEGTYLTTDKAVIIDVTQGILQKVNFGVNKKVREGEQKPPEESSLRQTEEQAPEKLLIPSVSEEKLEAKDMEGEGYTGLKTEGKTAEDIAKAESAVLPPPVVSEQLESKGIEEKDYKELKAEETGIKETEPEAVAAEGSEKKPIQEERDIISSLFAFMGSSLQDISEDIVFVGLADIKAGYTSVSGNIEPVEQDDKFTHGFWKEGRLAYYLKGKIKGKYLITSSLDTDREKKEMFRNLDPDKYYPVYGDASTVNYDATDTQGMLYLAVEWDKSKAMWGNYNTGMTDTELAQFNRSLYGAKLHYETVSTTEAGKAETKLIVFHANARQKAAHNEFLGTGGSLYYLRHKPIVEGSEKISIEVRDKDTDMVIAKVTQVEGKDYEIDYSNARIMFYSPVSQIAQSSSIISNALLDGNPLYVVADYEYEVNAIYNQDSYGGRVEQSLTALINKFRTQSTPKSFATGQAGQGIQTTDNFLKDIRLGGTYIKDEQDTGDYRLSGIDTSIYLGRNTEITAEYAESQAQGIEGFVSTDGGLTFTEAPTSGSAHGKAYSLKAQTRLFDKVGIFSYYKKIGSGFSDSTTISEQGKESAGIDVTWDYSDKINFRLTHDMQRLLSGGNAATTAQIGAGRTDTTKFQASSRWDRLKLTGEFKHVEVNLPAGRQAAGYTIDESISETNEAGNTVALRGDYEINKELSAFLEEQAELNQDRNDYRTTAGLSAQVFKWLSLRISETIGTDGNATSIGTNAKVDDRTVLYNTYSLSNSRMDGRKNAIISGGRTKVAENMDFTTEIQNSSSNKETTRTNIFGLSGEITERWGLSGSYERGMVQSYSGEISKRSAGSIGLSYIERRRIKASSKIEIRVDEGQEKQWQYLSYNVIQWQVNNDTTLFGKVNLSESINTTLNRTEAGYKEIVIGSAYRPVNIDNLNLLAKYTYLEDETASGQTDNSNIQEQRAHVLAGEAVYDLTKDWQVVEKIAFKQSDERVTGFDFTKSQTWLWINRLNYNLYRGWQVGAEYRVLVQKQARDMKKGALIEVARYLGKNLQVGVGYNFTDFSDDITSLDYTSQGPFIRLSVKITD
jgi:uncharacterized repeat protein (TIGR01451 family)